MLRRDNNNGRDGIAKTFISVVCKENFDEETTTITPAILSAVVLVGFGALMLGRRVDAAAEGKITGTVKLNGTAPHMQGIDMSKDPYCVKFHANSPNIWKLWWWARAAD